MRIADAAAGRNVFLHSRHAIHTRFTPDSHRLSISPQYPAYSSIGLQYNELHQTSSEKAKRRVRDLHPEERLHKRIDWYNSTYLLAKSKLGGDIDTQVRLSNAQRQLRGGGHEKSAIGGMAPLHLHGICRRRE
ncbi:hypothetical protein [Chromobacterium sphagni]|uniref:hypothetical protein n=1 Tax=Chromobacterium sphagni TaxID=1903179 RepID=UPI001113CBA3|nr:hypothetical protein [Chromobacterium sphagni]